MQQTSKVVKAGRCVGMVRGEGFFGDPQRALKEQPRASKIALGLKQTREIIDAFCRIGMIGSEHLLCKDFQGAPIEPPRADEIALGLKQTGEVIEARRRIGMVRSVVPSLESPGRAQRAAVRLRDRPEPDGDPRGY